MYLFAYLFAFFFVCYWFYAFCCLLVFSLCYGHLHFAFYMLLSLLVLSMGVGVVGFCAFFFPLVYTSLFAIGSYFLLVVFFYWVRFLYLHSLYCMAYYVILF